ncbi:hypothetical protein AYJ54_38500 [Bradyrhizobium centrolobii]|uniref:Uncharacterized protein n=1 Tax=Bradyrhizobium centrolobii TaxID=1505087 RepID=A0A176Z6R2_9BRAD|nr:hypothetical protein [Bradyrhizobium centrolobii]OAF16378.1 hypothetical protein AYJ54_38500 [Bradyrhizobium centrolobii]
MSGYGPEQRLRDVCYSAAGDKQTSGEWAKNDESDPTRTFSWAPRPRNISTCELVRSFAIFAEMIERRIPGMCKMELVAKIDVCISLVDAQS